jgi:hypothetical protein
MVSCLLLAVWGTAILLVQGSADHKSLNKIPDENKPQRVVQTVDSSEPVLLSYIKNSDYVVTARLRESLPVAKRKRGDKPDVAELAAGVMNKFDVEALHYHSDGLFRTDTGLAEAFVQFEILTAFGDIDNTYNKGRDYLLFLCRVRPDDSLFDTLPHWPNGSGYWPRP